MEHNEFQEKAGVISLLLETEGRVMLCLDATQKGVEVPRRFSNDPGLMLVLNSLMPQPIHILPDSVASELRFGGIPHYCVIPYEALWGVFNPDSNHGMTWPNSIPEKVRHTHSVLHIPIEKVRMDLAVEALASMEEKGEVPVGVGAPGQSRDVSSEGKSVPFLRVIEGGSRETPPKAPDLKDRKHTLRLVE